MLKAFNLPLLVHVCGEQLVGGWMQMRRNKNLEELVEGLIDENE